MSRTAVTEKTAEESIKVRSCSNSRVRLTTLTSGKEISQIKNAERTETPAEAPKPDLSSGRDNKTQRGVPAGISTRICAKSASERRACSIPAFNDVVVRRLWWWFETKASIIQGVISELSASANETRKSKESQIARWSTAGKRSK